jgi:methionyl-tRNA formyltransferase
MHPWPGSYTAYQGKKLRLFESRVAGLPAEALAKAGQILELGDTLVVATGNGAIAFREAQLEGRRRMDIRSLLNGFQMKVGELLC